MFGRSLVLGFYLGIGILTLCLCWKHSPETLIVIGTKNNLQNYQGFLVFPIGFRSFLPSRCFVKNTIHASNIHQTWLGYPVLLAGKQEEGNRISNGLQRRNTRDGK